MPGGPTPLDWQSMAPSPKRERGKEESNVAPTLLSRMAVSVLYSMNARWEERENVPSPRGLTSNCQEEKQWILIVGCD